MPKPSPHWSRIGEAGTIAGMKFLLLMYRLFGRSGFRLMLNPVLLYFLATRKTAREASRQYLKHVSSFATENREEKLTVFRHFQTFAEILLDKLLVWMGKISLRDLVIETPEVFNEINNSTRGGVIVVSHLGNTEVCGALAQQLPDVSITMLVYTQHAKKFNRLLSSAQPDNNIELLQVTDMSPATAMLLSDRVAAGEYIAIAGDRTPVTGEQRTTVVDFLGAPASMPQGAFILAGILTCPVYLMFCLKQGEKYQLYLERFTEKMFLPRSQRSAIIDQAVARYAKRLEHYCLRAPLQWFNFYPFWRHQTFDDRI